MRIKHLVFAAAMAALSTHSIAIPAMRSETYNLSGQPTMYADASAVTPVATVSEALADKDSIKFFEPTQADWNCCAAKIRAQQAAYTEAKGAFKWVAAHRLALWHFQRAWLLNNEAYQALQNEEIHGDVTALKKVQDLLLEARNQNILAEGKGHHLDEVQACRSKIDKNTQATLELIRLALDGEE